MDDVSVSQASRTVRSASVAEAVHATMHFARVLRRRVSVVIVAVAVSGLFGALYFTTSARLYQANASLLVIPTGADVWNPSADINSSRQALIPTYERLFHEDVVLDGAVRYLKQEPRGQVDFRSLPSEKWSGVIRRNLVAKRARRTNLIEIAYRSKDPRAAETIVAAIVRSYLDFMEKNHRDFSAESVRILNREQAEIEQRLVAKQKQLLAVKHRSGDLGLNETSQVVHPAVQRVLQLSERLVEVQQQELDLRATLTAVQDAITTGGDLRQHLVALEPIVGRELLLSVLGLNPQYTEISGQVEQNLIEDRARLAKLLRHYGAAHPDVIETERVINEAERYLADYQANVQHRLHQMSSQQLGPMLVNMLREKMAKTRSHERELDRQYKLYEAEAIAMADRMAEVSIVENEVQRLRQLHDTLLDRIAGIDINQNRVDVRVTVVSDPVADNRPVSPKLLLIGLICLAGGLVVGAGTVYVMDLMDDRFRSPDEIQEQLEAPMLGVIQTLPPTDAQGFGSICTYVDQDSPQCEAFRTLRTAICFSGRDLDCLAVTSSEPGDGKTTVLASLGVTYAQAGRRTLLIDADLRRPGLSKLLGVRGVAGLSQLLREPALTSSAFEQVIQKTVQDNLYMLPCGPRPTDPVELLAGAQFAELLAWADSVYDQVLVDCPPVMAASDAAVIARQTDGALMVIQPEKNHRRLVLRATQTLRMMQVELVGLVANRVGMEPSTGYYGLPYNGDAYGYDHEEKDDDRQAA